MGAGQRLVFTKIVVDDLDAQSSFYSDVLGQEVRHRITGGEGDGEFGEIVMGPADGDGPSLLLLHYLHRETPRPGEAVLGFGVADLERAVRAAEAAGGAVRSGPRSVPEAGVSVAQVEDPEGHLLEIVQYV